ncbi:hypothetical protein KIW84_UN0291 [Lathyrus oleraceus]|nr:hypothetical protein KIW84_UN0291 [Pisum sativum]
MPSAEEPALLYATICLRALALWGVVRPAMLDLAVVGAVINGCYLVDPASSHMLVSKIKPCMSFAKDVFINQERKLGARRRSDTVLVSTINDADQGSADVAFRTPLAPYEKSKSLGSGGSMVARLKLKGIDGRAPPGVEPAA